MNTKEKLDHIDDLVIKALYHSESPKAIEYLGFARAAIKDMRPKFNEVTCDHLEY